MTQQTPYERLFIINYSAVRINTSDPENVRFHFPVKQLRKVTAETPLPPKREEPSSLAHNSPVSPNVNGRARAPAPGTSSPARKARNNCGGLDAFKGTIIGNHARVVIPITLIQNSDIYLIQDKIPIHSFDDLETWMISFVQSFKKKSNDNPNRVLLRSLNPTDEQSAEPTETNGQLMNYEIVGLDVHAFTTSEQAKAWFSIFAPPTFLPSATKAFLDGVNAVLHPEPLLGKRKISVIDAAQDWDVGKLLTTVHTSSLLQADVALRQLAGHNCVTDDETGKRFAMMTSLLRKFNVDGVLADGARDSPILRAVRAKNYEMIGMLLEANADVLSRDVEGRSTLHIAARNGDLKALKMLLRCYETGNHVPVDAVDQNMRTPLMDAAEALSGDVVDYFLSLGANPCARDISNESVMHKLVRGGFNQKIAQVLVEAGCSLSAVNSAGMTASTLAASIPVAFILPSWEGRRTATMSVLPIHLDMSFTTIHHRASQGLLKLDTTNVARRPVFEYQFGLTIHPETETYVQTLPVYMQLNVTRGWLGPFCKCLGICNDKCSCVREYNHGSTVFTSRGRLLLKFPETQPIIMCPAMCKCSALCPLRTLSSLVSPDMEICFDATREKWVAKSMIELERGQFVCFLAGEIIHSRFINHEKSHRYLLYSRTLSVDVSRRANASRFFTDSVTPNLRVVLVREFDYSKPPQVAFFASEWIGKGEELTFDKTRYFENVQKSLRDRCFEGFRFE